MNRPSTGVRSARLSLKIKAPISVLLVVAIAGWALTGIDPVGGTRPTSEGGSSSIPSGSGPSGSGSSPSGSASDRSAPWEYDAVNNRHWHEGHGHWHDGPPPPEESR